jgi:signal transduction histidine kinase
MFRKLMIGAIASAAIVLSATAFAQGPAQGQSGTADEAKAMLEKAIAAVKADQTKALASFNAGTDGFKDRDLYPFCFNIADGLVLAGPATVKGKDTRTLKDPTGKAFGDEIYKAAAQDGKINEVSYMFPRPGATEPVAKVSFVTKVGDLGCGVGYYK